MERGRHREITGFGRILDKVAFLLFIAGIFGFGIAYGYLAHRNHWFPDRIVREAESAYRAWAQVFEEGSRPATFEKFVDAATDGPIASVLSKDVSDEWVLVTGGPYEFLEQCPDYGCLAWIVDRDGTVIHSWEANLDDVFGEIDNVTGGREPESFFPVGMHLLEDGGLLTVFQSERGFPGGAGLARFDRDGRLIWYNDINMHHWFTLDPEGTIYVPMHEVVETPIVLGQSIHELVCPNRLALMDSIAIVGPDGRLRGRINVLDLLLGNGYLGLVINTVNPCDPLHLNFIEYIDATKAEVVDLADVGDLLISLRDINTILIFSPQTGSIKWIETGRYVGQHSPRLTADGSILVFDNRGGDQALGQTRIIRQRVGDPRLSVIWPRAGKSLGEKLATNEAGHISVADDGTRALISITGTGDVLELELSSGDVLWRYEKIFSVDGYPQ
jgi:hypothetical protein